PVWASVWSKVSKTARASRHGMTQSSANRQAAQWFEGLIRGLAFATLAGRSGLRADVCRQAVGESAWRSGLL
ncbi:MAG: hypothetical protein P8I59_00475, partial [Pseudomonadales bacterium]|nr:hypothetical protein [Pseudomonadales bacterium]